jgi:catechol 2,3-dioxygenase-like lactoylglutathione lyase family enzyme
MIKGVHSMFYTSAADEMRAFLRDILELPFTDVGEGWLIFDIPDAEMGVHPADPEQGASSGMHHISFYCDDIEATVAKLKERGVEFSTGIEDHGYGLVTHLKMPGDFDVQLYQPRYKRNPRPEPEPAPQPEPKAAPKPAAKKKAPAKRKMVAKSKKPKTAVKKKRR